MIQRLTSKTETVRCAVYTRKSTEEGLEQEFNSLDAQREAGEAFIASQQHEGWLCTTTSYDDGGFSGGNMERPALQRLMTDIEDGKIDCVVVYKVDRLSRSLMDFSKIIEAFNRHGVSFVSVTQQFNTATSMGRLILNVLLSFAQFEREMISERTRDKIAATRRKGKWSGGMPLLGYTVTDGKLHVLDDEAQRVRQIFELYLRQRSLLATARELNARGWRTKQWRTKSGNDRGGREFTKTSLHTLLTNVTYIGKIRYKDEVHNGEHAAIVDDKVFDNVQELLLRNRQTVSTTVRNKYNALLRGLLHCSHCNRVMAHTYSSRGAKRYRYYVCSRARQQGYDICPAPSVPAGEIERFVVNEIRSIGRDDRLVREVFEQARESAANQVRLESVQDALRHFDQVWDAMPTVDRARLLELLIKRIDFNGTAGKLKITFHPTGIATLGNELDISEASA